MFATLIILLAVASGALWLYDSLTALPNRIRHNLVEPAYVPYARGIFFIALFILLVKVFQINILTILVVLTIASGLIWFIDSRYFKTKREAKKRKENFLVDYSRSLFWIFLVVLVLRAFVAQLFTVPTGSLEPTVMPGDILLVNQYSYGLRLPITHTKILSVGEPKVGDIAVFRYPADPHIDYIKRIVGAPGDHIVYKNKTLYINGKIQKQTFIENTWDYIAGGQKLPAQRYREDLAGKTHDMLRRETGGETGNFNITIPKGYYFAMGDNRDDSLDSRYWGLVPEKNFIGKAMFVLISFDGNQHRIRWQRIGKSV